MLPYRDSRFTVIALVVFFAIVIGYAAFEASGLIFGPIIDVPNNVTLVHNPYIVIKGRARRIASLSMNGAQIQVTEDGSFSQPYLLATGYNRIIFNARDQYGRSREHILEIMYVPTAGSNASQNSLPASTTKASTATSSKTLSPRRETSPATSTPLISTSTTGVAQ